MKLFILSLLCLILHVLPHCCCSTQSVSQNGQSPHPDQPTLEELTEFVVEKFTPYKEGFERWIPALVNSPRSPTKYDMQPQLDYIDCNTCQIGVNVIKILRFLLIPKDLITEVIIQGCAILQIADMPICRGTVMSYATPVMKILEDKKELTTDDFCGLLIPGCGKVNPDLINWDIRIDPTKPPSQPRPPLQEGVGRTQILQFTDIHLDLEYLEGTTSNCGQPEGCCRTGEGTGDQYAGKFGHFSCALPLDALDAMYDHAAATHTPKYIFLTGDYVHSAIWLYSVAENSRHIEQVTQRLADKFPNVPIFPLVGNHEPDVVNMFPPKDLWNEGFDLLWMYKIVARPFLQYVPENELANFESGGYYTVRPDPAVPFRLVVLNTNICYLQNFWLAYQTVDPTDQLQWFADTMLAAERSRETVYILGHILPGSGSCWTVWSDKFNRIINRFEGIIQAQFYGHSHREYFTLAFDEDQNPISASYSGPSGVTDRGNPAYKLYEVDGERGEDSTWEMIDHKTYILELAKSNSAGVAEFSELYSAKQLFGLNSLRPGDLYDLVLRMVEDDDLFQAYLRAHHRDYPNYNRCTDNECRGNTMCDLVVSNSGDYTVCQKIKDLIDPPSTDTTTVQTTRAAETNPPTEPEVGEPSTEAGVERTTGGTENRDSTESGASGSKFMNVMLLFLSTITVSVLSLTSSDL